MELNTRIALRKGGKFSYLLRFKWMEVLKSRNFVPDFRAAILATEMLKS